MSFARSLCLALCLTLSLETTALAAGADKGQHFGSLASLSVDMLETVRSMQEHVQMVSMRRDSEVVDALNGNGFQLVGDLIKGSIIDGMRAYVAVRGGDIVLVFRGTKVERRLLQKAANMLTDGDADLDRVRWFDPGAVDHDTIRRAHVHSGFGKEWRSVRDEVYTRINRHPGRRLWVFGHSLGAGLATLAALDIRAHTRREVRFIGSGSPRVGDDKFREAFERAIPTSLRLVIGHDVVPRIPSLRNYEHVGRLLIVDEQANFIAPGDIDTRPQVLFGWGPHNNEVYRDVAQALLERALADPSLVVSQRNHLTQAADAEREAHRTLRERTVGRLFDD